MASVIKLFTAVSYEFRVFFPGELFQPSVMFAGKAGAYLSEGSMLENLARNKRPSLLQK